MQQYTSKTDSIYYHFSISSHSLIQDNDIVRMDPTATEDNIHDVVRGRQC